MLLTVTINAVPSSYTSICDARAAMPAPPQSGLLETWWQIYRVAAIGQLVVLDSSAADSIVLSGTRDSSRVFVGSDSGDSETDIATLKADPSPSLVEQSYIDIWDAYPQTGTVDVSYSVDNKQFSFRGYKAAGES